MPTAMKSCAGPFAALLVVFSALAFGIPDLYAQSAKGEGEVVRIKTHSGRSIDLYKGSHALLIGVSEYEHWSDLGFVRRELAEVEAALKDQGFKVRSVFDPDSEKLEQAFEGFIDEYGYVKDNRLLFFYSGHGASRPDGSMGYLVPSDAPLFRNDPPGFMRKAVSMSRVMTWCREMTAKHALFLFDSCFSGTIFESRGSSIHPPPISDYTAKPVRYFISAGGPKEPVPARSSFTPSFVYGLKGEADLNRDGYITGTELGMYLHDKVLYYRTGQTPQFGKIRDAALDKGDFVFQLAGGQEDQGGNPRQARITQLLKEADALFTAGSLTTPVGSNALAHYRSVLALEPLNQKALTGLKCIIEQYTTWAKARIRAKDFDQAELFLSRASQVREGDVRVMDLRDKLRQAKYQANTKVVEKTQKNSVYGESIPTIELINKGISIRAGGSALAIYRISTNVAKHGVLVGKRFYKGFTPWHNKPKTGVCYFALGHDQARTTKISLWATSSAGKSAAQDMAVRIRHKRFRNDKIRLSQRTITALAAKLPGLPMGLDEIGRFVYINEHLRKQNNATIKTAALSTLPFQLWDEAFMRPKGKPMTGFGDKRTYYYGEKLISKAVHVGLDLADIAKSDIRAVAHGQVVLADNVGIYGNCILLDHGLGLMSLYAHLSSLLVTKGSYVSKHKLIGKSGNTGLALGDHLHFSVLVGGNFVQPSEWWDSSWVESNVFNKFEEAGIKPPIHYPPF